MTEKIVSLFLCAMLCFTCLGALSENVPALTDMTGRAINLDAPAERIVVIQPADCEILCAIGAGERIVGRGAYCDYPAEEVADIPVVNGGSELNIEQIIALAPDAVVMSKMDHSIEQVKSLEKAGVCVVVTDVQRIDNVYDCIELLGRLTGKTAAAAALSENMKSRMDAVAQTCENTEKTVYFEVSELKWGLWAAGTHTFMDELATLCGLTNIFTDVEGWQAVSEEQVLLRNPDYIVTTAMCFGEGPLPVEEIMGRSGWEQVAAVKNGDVFNADGDAITRPGPRLVDAAEALCAFINRSK